MDNLEVELAPELQLARIARRGDLAGCARVGTGERRSRRRGGQGVIHIAPLCMVKHVVTFEPQLKPRVVIDDDVLEDGYVEVLNSRPGNRIAMEVAERAIGGLRKCRRVIPHGELSRGLTVTVRGRNFTSQVVGANMTETAVA